MRSLRARRDAPPMVFFAVCPQPAIPRRITSSAETALARRSQNFQPIQAAACTECRYRPPVVHPSVSVRLPLRCVRELLRIIPPIATRPKLCARPGTSRLSSTPAPPPRCPIGKHSRIGVLAPVLACPSARAAMVERWDPESVARRSSLFTSSGSHARAWRRDP